MAMVGDRSSEDEVTLIFRQKHNETADCPIMWNDGGPGTPSSNRSRIDVSAQQFETPAPTAKASSGV
jgi:hypothetical protein